jgi:hypothetical protein
MDETQVRDSARQDFWRAILNLAVLAVAAHSIALGIAFLLFPMRTLGLVGWEYAGPVFWPSQAGLFLLILGVAYAAAIRLRALVWFVIGSKAGAFVFLLVSAAWVDAPRIVGLLGCGDGLMGLAVALAFWRLRRSERSR